MEKRYKLKTAPTFQPVDIDDLKDDLRITHENQDAYLYRLLESAIDDWQRDTGRQIALASWYLYLDEFPASGLLEIEKGPVSGITTVKYFAPGASEMTTMPSTDYQLDNSELTARLKFFETPNTDSDKMNAVEIEFTNGWATRGDIPVTVTDAIRLKASDRYLNPHNPVNSRVTAADNLSRKYRVQRY